MSLRKKMGEMNVKARGASLGGSGALVPRKLIKGASSVNG
jgi:hypothetical protein